VKTALRWVIAIALVAGAWGITLLAPDENAGGDAFIIDMSLGEHAVGRNIAATVLDVRAASTVTGDAGWEATGTWLVVDVSIEAVASQQGGFFADATLQIGDRTFSASERGPDDMTIYRTPLVPGVPQTGSLLFELPEDALTGTATLLMATGYSTWGDSMLRLQFDLDAVERVDSVDVEDVTWTNP
jgi:hypothetical protein